MKRDIFLDDISFRHHHFRALIAVKTALSKKNSSRHTSRFEVRDLRRFLKVIFLHLTSTIRARWSLIVQFRDNFLMCSPIDGIHNLGSVSSSNFVIKCICDKVYL